MIVFYLRGREDVGEAEVLIGEEHHRGFAEISHRLFVRFLPTTTCYWKLLVFGAQTRSLNFTYEI